MAFNIETKSAIVSPALAGSLAGTLAVAQERIEKTFLDGGEGLTAVKKAVGSLTETLDGLAHLLDPRATAQVFDGMKTVVGDLSGLTGTASRKQEAFGKISGLCTSVQTRAEDMREIIRYLRTIAVTVKITGASIPEFTGFADEIRERIQAVSDEIGRFGDQLTGMRNRLVTANTSSADVIRDFASTIPLLVDNMDRSAVALAEQQKRMAATASQLKQISGSIQGKVASVLSALQIGDATRQRIERVMSMLAALEDFKSSEEGRGLDADMLAALEGAIAGLAHAQIEESIDDLQTKCANISSTIASFTADAAEVLSLRDDLSGRSQPNEDNVLAKMQSDLAQASNLSAKVGDRTRDLDQVVDSVGESTQALIAGITTIRKVKIDIFYMALNSNLACTRLGDAGRSVNAASGELRIFADRLEIPADGIVVQMQEIEAARDVLTSGNSQSMSDLDEPLEQARIAVDAVANSMDVGLTALSREGDLVFSSIDEAVRRLDFRSDLDTVLDDCLRIAADQSTGARPLAAGTEAIGRFTAKIYKSYMTAQERAIHERFLPGVAEMSADDHDDVPARAFG